MLGLRLCFDIDKSAITQQYMQIHGINIPNPFKLYYLFLRVRGSNAKKFVAYIVQPKQESDKGTWSGNLSIYANRHNCNIQAVLYVYY